MRSLLLIGLLIVHSAYSQHPTSQMAVVEKMNEMRSLSAEIDEVANMNELVYREDLVQLLADQLAKNNGCPDRSIVMRDGYHIVISPQNDDELTALKLAAFTQSGSTVMASGKSICSLNGEEVVGYIIDASDIKPVRGNPGTRCPAGRTRNAIGLCALVGNGRRGYVRKDIDVNIPTNILDVDIEIPDISDILPW
ncbi:hypothetical protein CRE_22981 [Caenorhabditis remanei]|uniref:Uncharacterized protein n=1 Tax=Caenorhabditis remanei TaxID=31234 RepID=E3MW71_CAERE|nr:hypothetical protein CRE_22981 [Caenorhabditis remanei]